MNMLADNPRFDRFLADIRTLVDEADGHEPRIIREGQALLGKLVSDSAWYPEALAQSDPLKFKQYMLHRAEDGRLTVLGVVWGPGQSAPPHDHTIWGLIGQLRGTEVTCLYDHTDEGLRLRRKLVLRPGETTALSPHLGDIHDVRNGGPDVAISIHVYGGDLEALSHRRTRYDAETGEVTPFQAEYH